MGKIRLTFEKQQGAVSLDRLVATLQSRVALLPNGSYEVVVSKRADKRSVNQNRLMWLWFACIANEIGTTRDDIYDYYVGKFLRSIGEVRGEQFYKVLRTSKLTTEQFKEFLDQVQAHAASFFGITLPTPDDLAWESFENYYEPKLIGYE